MRFPVEWHLWRLTVPAHLVCESLGYFAGFRLFLWLRRGGRDSLSDATRFTVITAAALGAVLGSKILVWLQHPLETWAHGEDPNAWFAGKTIVGGLLGGLLAVEWAKRRLGEQRRTGDLFVLPLCLGMAIGRVGCFLAGLTDATYGLPTTLPWGVDFGDGIARHPTQLYEIVALALIAVWAWRAMRRPEFVEGDAFRGFLILYMGFRLGLECVKPEPRPYLGLSAIQVACVLTLLYYGREAPRVFGGARPSNGV